MAFKGPRAAAPATSRLGGYARNMSLEPAWVIRSGRYGEREAWALSEGYSGGGWDEVPDLSPLTTREQVAEILAEALPELAANVLANYTGQMYALRRRIQPGHLIVMPLKSARSLALGVVTGGYRYLAQEPDPSKRHVVEVDWRVTDLPRSDVKQDLLYTLGSLLSIFAPSKNHAVERLWALLETRSDPGQVSFMDRLVVPGKQKPISLPESDGVDEPELQVDIDETARDQITARVAEEFYGHGLETLVAAILRAEGFTCTVAGGSTDGGIDIIAGRGILGMDSPRIIAQVKSGGQIGDPVVSQLHGVLSTQGADQGLLVAWGGLSKPARDSLKGHQLKIRVWESSDVVDAVLRTYDQLPEEIRTRLPLKRVWMVAD